MCVEENISALVSFHSPQMIGEEVGEEHGKVQNELLACVAGVRVCLRDVGTWGYHPIHGGHHHGEQNLELGVVFRPYGQSSNFRHALERHVSKFWCFEETSDEQVDDGGLEDESERYPVQEAQESVQGCLDKAGLLRLGKNLFAEVEDFGELSTHLVLEALRFGLRHLLGGEVEDLLGQQLEDNHVVFAEGEVGFGRLYEF